MNDPTHGLFRCPTASHTPDKRLGRAMAAHPTPSHSPATDARGQRLLLKPFRDPTAGPFRRSTARISEEDRCTCRGDCLGSEHSCRCTGAMGGVHAYTREGRLRPHFLKRVLEEVRGEKKLFCEDECPLTKGAERESAGSAQSEVCRGHTTRSFIKECCHLCGCNRHRCLNRVVQNGIHLPLQVFFTENGKGWGVRCLEEVEIGTFVCEYVGEILTNTELDDENKRQAALDDKRKMQAALQDERRREGAVEDKSKGLGALQDGSKPKAAIGPERGDGWARHTFPIMLDADWTTEHRLDDDHALCLDATWRGNVGRFINHRCKDANLIDIPVLINTPTDKLFYHVAFFTGRKVPAGEELTWDYGIDFGDTQHPIKAFSCLCCSPQCRDKTKRK